LAIILIFPEAFNGLTLDKLNAGGLGILIILAYAMGHLTQALGNSIEYWWWKLRKGKPQCWITIDNPEKKERIQKKKERILSDKQAKELLKQIPLKTSYVGAESFENITKSQWINLVILR